MGVVVSEQNWHRARLIPVSGVKASEVEQRATSAFLAVLSVVRDFSNELLTPLGASSATRAAVETFTEVTLATPGKTVRPDGLVRVTYGKRSFVALVEVKTGDNTLGKDQINEYWQAARQRKFDHVITISNEIATSGSHPVPGLKVQKNSPVQVSHWSWARILSVALRLKNHMGVDDPEQAWLLGELIRYLEHAASGVMPMADMGRFWTAVREGARAGNLTRRTEGVTEVVTKVDEMFTYTSLLLSSEVGAEVTVVLPKAMRDQTARIERYAKAIIDGEAVRATLRVPDTAGDIRAAIDFRSQQMTASMEVRAPADKGARGRIGWLLRQLEGAGDELIVQAYALNARDPRLSTVGELREDRDAFFKNERFEPYKFVLVKRISMPKARKSSAAKLGLTDGFRSLVNDFYDVAQDVTAWQAPAPKRQPVVTEEDPDPEASE